MGVVALIGPDGAGKTTVARALEDQLPFRTKYLYMGGQLSHGSNALPTARLWIMLRGWRDNLKQKTNTFTNWLVYLLSALLFAIGLMDEWLRQALILGYKLRGFIVILDRHYLFHHHAYIVGRTNGSLPLGTRIHAFILEYFYPRPDLVIYLDASPEVMFARKGEKSVEFLKELRERYLEMADRVRYFIVIDANQPQEKVIHDAVEIVTQFRNGHLVVENHA